MSERVWNNFLSNFGCVDTDRSKPLFRLVWSDTQTELRKGIFREYLGDLFLREVEGIKEMPKYSHIKERWVLERFIPGIYVANEELPLSQFGQYEPIYVFESNKGEYLPPNLRVLEILMSLVHNDETNKGRKMSEIMDQMEEKEKKEIEHFMDMLEISEVTNALHMGEAVGYTKELKGIN